MRNQSMYEVMNENVPVFMKLFLNVRETLVDATEVVLINQDKNHFHKGIALGLSECHLDTDQDQNGTWFTMTLNEFEEKLNSKVAAKYGPIRRVSETSTYYVEYGTEEQKLFTVYLKDDYVKSVYMYMKAENEQEDSMNTDLVECLISLFSPWFKNTVSTELNIFEQGSDAAPPNRVVVCGNVIYYYTVSRAPLYPGFTIAAAYKSDEGQIVIGPM